MKQAFCLYVGMFLLVFMFADIFCECAESFKGEKLTVEYKSVLVDGNPALLVVDNTKEILKNDATEVATVSETGDIDLTQNGKKTTTAAATTAKTKKVRPPNLLAAYNASEFKISDTCENFVKLGEDEKLSDLQIPALVPEYDPSVFTDTQKELLTKSMENINKNRTEIIGKCQEKYDKIVSAFDAFSKAEGINPGDYVAESNGAGCYSYSKPSFDIESVRKKMVEATEPEFVGTEFNAFRKNIQKKEAEMMSLVDTKFKTCLMKFRQRERDRAQIVNRHNGFNYLAFDKDGVVNTSGRKRSDKRIRWKPTDIVDTASNAVVGVQLKDAIGDTCLSAASLEDPSLTMTKCDVSKPEQQFVIADAGDGYKTMCNKSMTDDDGTRLCVTSEKNELSKLEDAKPFSWRIIETS